jgi:hypothetical protein
VGHKPLVLTRELSAVTHNLKPPHTLFLTSPLTKNPDLRISKFVVK